MNKIFRVIWSYVLKQFVVVNELTKSRSKEKSARAAVGVVSSTESAKFALRPAALVTAAAFAAFSVPSFAAESEGWLRLDEPAAAEAAKKESAYGRLPQITASSDFVRAARAESTNALERAVRTSADEADSRVVRAAYSPKQLAVAAPRADVPAVVRNGKAVEGAQDGSFSFKDLKLEGKTPFGSDKAFDPYRWDNHKTEAGDVNGVDQTVHIGSGATSGGTNDRKWVTLKDEGWTAVASGNPGSKGNLTASDVLQDGGVVTIKDDAGNVITIDKDNAGDLKSAFKNEFTLGGTDAYSFVDEVTGANRTANIWEPLKNNPDGFYESKYLPDEKFSRPDKSDIYDENGNRLGSGQYVDKVFFSVKGDGGLRVQVNDEDEAPEDFHAVLKVSGQDKYSTVFEAIDGGKISYESKTNVQLATDGDVSGGNNSIGWTHEYISYTGKRVADLDTLVYEKKDEDGNVVESKTVAFNDAAGRAELENAGFSWDEGDLEKRIAFVVNNEETLIAFNEYLKGKLGKKTEDGSGSYDETWYQTEFRSAFTIGTEEWTAEFDPGSDFYVPPTDSTAKGSNQQQVSFIRAGRSETASNGTDYGRVVIKDGAEITMTGSLASILRVDGKGYGETVIGSSDAADAVIEKGGKLAVTGAYGWAVNSHGGAVWNEGTIDVGQQTGEGEGLRVQDGYGLVGVHLQDGARFENKAGGLVQYDAGSFGKAVEVESGSTFANSGVLNMITGAFRAPTKDDNYGIRENFKRSSLVTVSSDVEGSKSRFVNEERGLIYLGGGHIDQSDLEGKTNDELINEILGENNADTHEQPIDVFLVGEDGIFENKGSIATGTGVRNMNIVRLEGEGAQFTNTGTIVLNAVKTSEGDQSFNAVVLAGEGTQAVNDGNIYLNGVNAVALQALEAENTFDTKDKPRVINKGTITVGAAGEGSAPNYAIWAEGTGTVAQNAGTINLAGDRAIGIHARNGADIEVTERASIVFDSKGNDATGQIAYLIYGSGENGDRTSIHDSTSSIENSHKVTADYSTYFRVDTGATLDLQSGFYDVASEGSSIITVTGEGARFTAENSSTDTLHLAVDGKDSAALLVTGGGYAFWEGNVDLTVSGKDSAIAIISGEYIDVETNEADSDRFTETFFDNKAAITGNKSGDKFSGDAVAFRVKSGGVLRNQGSINFKYKGEGTSTFTGVLLEGGTLRNGWDENGNELADASKAVISVDGVAVEVRGLTGEGGENETESVLENVGLIEANDGTAAVYLTQNANLLLTASEKGTITASGTADAIRLGADAGTLTLRGAKLEMKEGGSGNAVENRSAKAVNVYAADIQIEDGIGIHSEKINFGTLAGNATTIHITGEGTGILQEKVAEDGQGSATDANLTFNNTVTVVGALLDGTDNDYRGTGIAANTTGTLKINGTLTGLNTGAVVLGDAAGVTVDANANIRVGSDAGEVAGAGIDLSSSGDTVKTVNDVSVVKGSKIEAAGTADGLDFSGSRIAGSINVAGTVSVEDGAAVNLSGASGATDSPLSFTLEGTLTVSNSGSGAGVLGSNVAASMDIVNRGKIAGGIRLENVAENDAGHQVLLEAKSELTGGVLLSTGGDKVTVEGRADAIETQAGSDTVKIHSTGAARKVELGADDDTLLLNGLQNVTIATENGSNYFLHASGDEGFDVFALGGSTVTVANTGAKTIENFEGIELTESKLTLRGEEALFLEDFAANVPTSDTYKAQVAFKDAGSNLTLDIGTTHNDLFRYGWTMEGKGTLRVEGDADDLQERFAFDFGTDPKADVLADWTGEHFTGKFELADAYTKLDGLTARALRSSSAYVENGAVLAVGRTDANLDADGNENVFSYLKELHFDGGTVVWDGDAAIEAASGSEMADRGQIVFTDSSRKINLDGGKIYFGSDPKNKSTVTVVINTEGIIDGSQSTNNVTNFTLMEQDEGSVDVQLIQAEGAKFHGDLDNIELELIRAQDGGTLNPEDLAVDLKNGNLTTAVAYYNYGLSTSSLGDGHGHGYQGDQTGEQNGLYLAKRLERIKLLDNGDESSALMTLRGNEKSYAGNELHALLYGYGGFRFTGFNPDPEGDARAVGYITNGDNVFSGKTLVGTGTTLVVAVSNALGGKNNSYEEVDVDGQPTGDPYEGLYTKEVNVQDNAIFRLGVYGTSVDKGYGDEKVEQTIGSLNVNAYGEVDLGESKLVIAGVLGGAAEDNSSLISGSIAGTQNSELCLETGYMLVESAYNTDYHGTTVIGSGARASIFDGLALGDGTISFVGNRTDDSTLWIGAEQDFQLGAKVTSNGRNALIDFGEMSRTPYGSEFRFAKDNNAYRGTLALTSALYDFAAKESGNETALNDATLDLRSGVSVYTSGQNKLASVVFGSDNKVDFHSLTLGRAVNDYAFILGGTGSGNAVQFGDGMTTFTVQTDEEGRVEGGESLQEKADGSVADGAVSLLDQDDGSMFTALIKHEGEGNVSKITQDDIDDHLKLVGLDDEGTEVELKSAVIELMKAGSNGGEKKIADGYYDLVATDKGSFLTSNEKGDIGVTSKLTRIDIVGGQTVTFDDVAGETKDNEFSALITEQGTGGGNIAIAPVDPTDPDKANEIILSNKKVILSNKNNRFAGTTTVLDGAYLTLGDDDVLGSLAENELHQTGFTSNVILTGTSSVLDLNGKSQTVGAVSATGKESIDDDSVAGLREKGGVVDFGEAKVEGKGNLRIAGASDSVISSIRGAGSLTLEKSDLYIDRDAQANTSVDFTVGSAGAGRLIAGADGALGTGKVNLTGDDDVLVLSLRGSDNKFTNDVSGAGSMEFWSGTNVTVLGDADADGNSFMGGVTVKNGANVAMGNTTTDGRKFTGSGDLTIEAGGTLTMNVTGDWNLDTAQKDGQLVEGGGTLAVVQNGESQGGFRFDEEQAGGMFTGRFDLTNIRIGFNDKEYADEGRNLVVLKDVTLVLNDTSVGDFNATGIVFAGFETTGEDVRLDYTNFENKWSAYHNAENVIYADSFNFGNSTGTVEVDLGDVQNSIEDVDEAVDGIGELPLLDQDNGNVIFYLGRLTAGNIGNIDGSLGGFKLKLLTENGLVAPANPYGAVIVQDKDGVAYDAATGYYNLGLSTDEKGFGVSFGLQEIWIYGGKTLELAAGRDNTLSARLTEHPNSPGEVTAVHPEGIGSIEVVSGKTVRLANPDNDITGKATIADGATLVVASSGALGGGSSDEGKLYGYVSNVWTESGTLQLGDTNAKDVEQTIGTIHVGEGGGIDLQQGSKLTIAGGFASDTRELADNVISGRIKGDSNADLIILGGTELLVSTDDNVTDKTSSFLTTVTGDSTLTLGNSKSLGTGVINLTGTNDGGLGTLIIGGENLASDWTMENALSGAGNVDFTGNDHALFLKDADKTFTGTLSVSGGIFGMQGSALAEGETEPDPEQVNANVMANASLKVVGDSRLTLSGGRTTLANLTLSDSTLTAGSIVSENGSYYSSGWIDMTGAGADDGVLTIKGSNTLELSGLGNINDFSLLAQDDGVVATIVKAKTVEHADGSVMWKLPKGSDDLVEQELQDGAATGYYGVADHSAIFENGNDKGLFVRAQLLEAEVHKGRTLVLSPVEGAEAGTPGASFSASITGEGDIRIDGNVTLNHVADERFVTDFTGKTLVSGGSTLRLATDGSLGTATSHTSEVELYGGATLVVLDGTDADLNEQYAGGLTVGADGAKVQLGANSTLYLTGTGSDEDVATEIHVADALQGTGNLEITGGTHRIRSANANYGSADGKTTVAIDGIAMTEGGTSSPVLEIGHSKALGQAVVDAEKGTLAFADYDGSAAEGFKDAFTNTLTGSGTVLAMENTDVTIDGGDKKDFSGVYKAAAGGKLTLEGAEEFGDAVGVVDAGGELALRVALGVNDKSYLLENKVTGAGTFSVDLGVPSDGYALTDVDNQFNISKGVADTMSAEGGFTGTLALTNARLRIQDVASNAQAPGNYAETALANAMLEIGAGSRVMVSENDPFAGSKTYHEIGGLSFSQDSGAKGTLRLGEDKAVVIGGTDNNPLLHVKTLDASGNGVIEINIDDDAFTGDGHNAAGTQEKYHSLLDQDDGDLLSQLVRATDDVVGTAGNLELRFMHDGEVVKDAGDSQTGDEDPSKPVIKDSLAKIHQIDGGSDTVVAVGHYGYRASVYDDNGTTSGENSNNGIWLAYGLKQVDIQGGQTLVLTPGSAGRPGSSDFNAQITEVQYAFDADGNIVGVVDKSPEESVGNVEVRGSISLSNSKNAYHGTTLVTGDGDNPGVLRADADNVLGQDADNQHTSLLVLDANAGFDLNGHHQTIGSLAAGGGAWIDLDGGNDADAPAGRTGAELIIENGGYATSDNALRGTGHITLESGVFEVGGDNTGLGGTVTIGAPQIETVSNDAGDGDASETKDFVAIAVIHDSNGFGSSDIVFADKTSLLYMDNVKSVEESAVFDNRLKGEGTVRADATDIIVTGDNTGFTGTWQIGTGENYAGADDAGNHKFEGTAEASTMRFTELASLGGTAEAGWADFEIGAGSTLVLGIGQSYTFENVTSGEGGVTIDAGYSAPGIANVVELGSNFAHTGLTHVVSGGIRSTGDVIVDEPGSGEGGDGGESGADNGTSGDDPVVGTLPADGPAVAQLPADTGDSNDGTGADDAASSRTTLMGDVQLDEGTFMEGFAGVNGTLTNAGTVYVNWKRYADEALGKTSSTVYDDAHAHTLKIAGDYVGEGGTLVFNGALAGDDSPVDTIEVAGSASGTGKVQVHNLGGKGDLTSPHGITLITIEGDSTLTLSQDGRIVAGAYDYVLLRDPDSRRFYLQSTAGEYPIPPDVPIGPLVRPEAGAYMAASLAANLAEMRLHDRAGESHYVDPLTGEVKETSMWMRQTGTHAHFRSAGETLRTHMTGGVTQLGGDIIRRSGEGDVRANFGLFGTALYAKSSTRSTLSSHSADTSSDGYTVGVYATLFNGQGERLDQGGYLDLWAQYAWLDHEIRPKELATEEVDADGIIASVEAGWTFQLGTTGKNTSHAVDWSLQPQFQAIYEGVKLDEHVETEGTRVEMTGEGNVKTRLGFRLQASPESQPGERRGQGFLEFNWIHNTKTVGVEMDGVEVESEGMKDAGEVRFGFEGELTENLHGWISGGYLAGGSGYHEETVNVGLKYLW